MGTQRLSTMVKGQSTFPLVAPIAPFRRHGETGAWVSDLLPHIAGVVDEFTIVKDVPPVPQVLFATTLLNPGESVTVQFRAPSQPGDYPFVCTFPGHWRVMNGVLRVR